MTSETPSGPHRGRGSTRPDSTRPPRGPLSPAPARPGTRRGTTDGQIDGHLLEKGKGRPGHPSDRFDCDALRYPGPGGCCTGSPASGAVSPAPSLPAPRGPRVPGRPRAQGWASRLPRGQSRRRRFPAMVTPRSALSPAPPGLDKPCAPRALQTIPVLELPSEGGGAGVRGCPVGSLSLSRWEMGAGEQKCPHGKAPPPPACRGHLSPSWEV